MQPDHEADELQALLRAEYSAPRLDDQFSADLIARLQAEATPPPSLKPGRPRRSRLAIGLAIANIAALVVFVLWIAIPGIRPTNHEAARRAESDSNRMALQAESELGERIKSDRLENMSESARTLSALSESRSLTLSDRNVSESKIPLDSRPQSKGSLATDEKRSIALAQTSTLSSLSARQIEWPNISATAALADMLYVVDGGHLYEVNPGDGSRRNVGTDDWRDTAAMGSSAGRLYLVCDNQLYEVNPKTGARRGLGAPTWLDTKAILTSGDRLYIVSQGLLHRVNPTDGSRELLRGKNNPPSHSRQAKP